MHTDPICIHVYNNTRVYILMKRQTGLLRQRGDSYKYQLRFLVYLNNYRRISTSGGIITS